MQPVRFDIFVRRGNTGISVNPEGLVTIVKVSSEGGYIPRDLTGYQARWRAWNPGSPVHVIEKTSAASQITIDALAGRIVVPLSVSDVAQFSVQKKYLGSHEMVLTAPDASVRTLYSGRVDAKVEGET